MDVLLIILLVVCVAAAVAAMVLSKRNGKCASCPYNDNCSRKDCVKEGDD